MSNLSKEVVDLINNDSEAVKILVTSDKKGVPHADFKGCLTVLEDGNLAFAEAFEGSQTNINLVSSIWFNRDVELTVRGKDGRIFQIKGKPYRYVYTGPLFKKFYIAIREKRGKDSELAGVWIITPQEVKDASYQVKKRVEDEKHPYLKHLDRESVYRKNKNSCSCTG